MKPCVFCLQNGIIGEDEILARTDRAYLVTNERLGVPDALMIIPFEHIEGRLPDWWQEEINTLLQFVPWLQKEEPSDYNLNTNFGANAGQGQPHVHTHLTPRTPEQGRMGLGGFIRDYMRRHKTT